MFSLVLVFYGVADPCIRIAVKSMEMAKMHINPLGLALDCTKSVIEHTLLKRPETKSSAPMLEPRKQRSNASVIEGETHDQVHSTSTAKPTLPKPPSLTLLRRGFPNAITCDRSRQLQSITHGATDRCQIFCRSLVQIVVQRGVIERRWNIGPYQCD
jgi:hypothetical protein